MPEEQLTQNESAYQFSAKATDGRDIEQSLTAPSLEAATLESWDVIQQHQRNGVQIQSARIDWNDADGPQVSYIYDRTQGFELSKPAGLDLENNSATYDAGQQMRTMEDSLRQQTQPAGPAHLATEQHHRHSPANHQHEEQQHHEQAISFGY
jgi:hypothetical protein